MAFINQKTRFATSGARFMRSNPDGTIPTKDRLIGFAGTCNLSAVLSSHKANLVVQVDGAAAETKEVDFTGVSSEAAVTVAEAVTKLNAATVTGATFSADATTGRLKLVMASGTYIKVTGALAAALDFGQGIAFGGNGLEFLKYFGDEVISIGLPKDIKDKEEIDLEGANGGITRMVLPALLQGLSPVVALKVKDYELMQLIQGGTYNASTAKYDPPTSDDTERPIFFMEIYSPIYSEGVNKVADLAGYEMILIRSCQGLEGDVPIEAKSWAQYAFNLDATEYWTEGGVKYPAYQEGTLSISAFTNLAVDKV